MTMDDLAVRLAKVEERQHDLHLAFQDARIRFNEVRAELEALDDEVRRLAPSIAKRVAENETKG